MQKYVMTEKSVIKHDRSNLKTMQTKISQD